MAEERYPILGKGEILVQRIEPSKHKNLKGELRSFHTARERLLPQFEALLNNIQAVDRSMRLERVFFQVAVDSTYLAKSYFPESLVKNSGWDMVGSRPWKQQGRDGIALETPELARRLFFCADPLRIEATFSRLENPSRLIDKEKGDFIKIDHLGLQAASDRLIGFQPKFTRGAVELVFHPMEEHEWKECKRKLSRLFPQSADLSFLWTWQRGSETQLKFLPARLSRQQVENIGGFNPLRAVRPMPSISFPRINKAKTSQILRPPVSPILRAIYPEIAIVDGGVDPQIPHLKGWVSNIDVTPEPVAREFLEHGTAVCGAALYGSYDAAKEPEEPKLKVRSFRVFPVPKEFGIDLDLYRVLDWLEEIVTDPQNSRIHVYVLSFGPNMPVEDDEVNRFTSVLDALAYQHDVLFVIAAGNEGSLNDPFNRIQPPADVVNGIGVGAYSYTSARRVYPAPYCCIGPGRPGSMVKPDVSAFGGSDDCPFHVLLAGTDGEIAEEQGTSFAAPVVASIAGNLLHRASAPEIITPQITKAILIHHAKPFPKLDRAKYGWGALCQSPEELMQCTANEVKVLYNGVVDLTRWVRLQLPFPEDLDYSGKVQFEWTLVYACEVRAATPDDYTLAGTEIIFRPNETRFNFNKDGKNVTVDKLADPDRATQLMSDGWRKSLHPASTSYKKEQEHREQGKWDTVLRGKKKVDRDNVRSPVLDVHAIGRGDWDHRGGPGRINYAAVVSVRVSDPNIPLYTLVRVQLPQLVPVQLRARARQRIA